MFFSASKNARTTLLFNNLNHSATLKVYDKKVRESKMIHAGWVECNKWRLCQAFTFTTTFLNLAGATP